MRQLKRSIPIIIGILFITFSLFANETTEPDFSTPEGLFNSIDWLFSGLVLIGGYLSYLIPGLNRIDQGVYRVLSFAVIVGIGFVSFGFSDVISLAMSYFMSTSLYEVVLKLIIRSPKPETEK